MAAIALQEVNKSGAVLTYTAAAAAGDTYEGLTGCFIHAHNSHASVTRTITIAAVTDPLITAEAGSIDIADIAVTIAAITNRFISVPPTHISPDGSVAMTYDDETNLSIAVLHVPQ